MNIISICFVRVALRYDISSAFIDLTYTIASAKQSRSSVIKRPWGSNVSKFVGPILDEKIFFRIEHALYPGQIFFCYFMVIAADNVL